MRRICHCKQKGRDSPSFVESRVSLKALAPQTFTLPLVPPWQNVLPPVGWASSRELSTPAVPSYLNRFVRSAGRSFPIDNARGHGVLRLHLPLRERLDW